MSDDTPPPEPDRTPGAPHPREAAQIFGQDEAQAAFLDAFTAGRLHHAWLITGPRGVGKATLAWRIARYLLATQPGGQTSAAPPAPTTLDIPGDHPVVRRMRALSEPRLFLLRRPWDQKSGRLRQEITVDEMRRLNGFFALSVPDGGHRVVIVDAADEMNPNAANALLKRLEEPPKDTVLLLISHQPFSLLSTIVSRCRTLRCLPLSAPDMSRALTGAGIDPGVPADRLTALAQGSAGAAVRLISLGGLDIYAAIVALFTGPPDRAAGLRLADSAAGRQAGDRYEMMLDLFDLFLSRLARTGVKGPPTPEATPGEADLMQRMAPDPQAARKWADLARLLGTRARHARAVNLDPAAVILDMVLKIQQLAAATSL